MLSKHIIKIVGALFAIGLLLSGMAWSQQDEDAIREQSLQFEQLFAAGDAGALAAMFTEDVRYIDAFGQVHEGRQGVQELYVEFIDEGFTQLSFEIIEIMVLNDTAYEIGRYTATGDELEPFEGYYLTVMVRENGEWLYHRVIVNVVMPEPPMEE